MIDLMSSSVKYFPVIDVASPNFKTNKTMFKVFTKDYRGRTIKTSPAADILTEKYFTDELMRSIMISSNRYRSQRRMSWTFKFGGT